MCERRNKIVFVNEPILDVCNDDLIKFINDIQFIFSPNVTITMQVTNLGIRGIEIKGDICDDNIIKLISLCDYLKINDKLIIEEKMIELINNQFIYRSFTTFHQNDDIIRNEVHNYFKKIQFNNILCVGGECYIYPKLIEHDMCCIMTDYKDIYEDAMYNKSGTYYYLVDYNTFYIPILSIDAAIFNTAIFNAAIFNVAKSGLSVSMCECLNKSNINTIFIISCNFKSHERNWSILKKTYNIITSNTIKTSYIVSIYHLEKIK